MVAAKLDELSLDTSIWDLQLPIQSLSLVSEQQQLAELDAGTF